MKSASGLSDPGPRSGETDAAWVLADFCRICGISEMQVSRLIPCLIVEKEVCTACCASIGGPFDERCRGCEWGRRFWEGHDDETPSHFTDDQDLYV
ncbi:MAG: hypothetical protein ACT4PT_06580 [Methanobacteriota archaeon]